MERVRSVCGAQVVGREGVCLLFGVLGVAVVCIPVLCMLDGVVAYIILYHIAFRILRHLDVLKLADWEHGRSSYWKGISPGSTTSGESPRVYLHRHLHV